MLLAMSLAEPVNALLYPDYQAGGDRLISLQNNDGGWDWPLDDGNPSSGSAPNTIAPITMGLAQAYQATGDPDYRDALEDAGDLLLSKTNNFSPSDGYLAAELDAIFGGSTYVSHMESYFYDPLAAGTYDKDGAGINMDTGGYIDSLSSQGIQNLAAWDVGMGLAAAVLAGASDTSTWIARTYGELSELKLYEADTNGNILYYYDFSVLGVAGALYGLSLAGEPALDSLAQFLVGSQLTTGGFSWHPWATYPGDETIQPTAYSILALNAWNRPVYLAQIQAGGDYLAQTQLSTGGWENFLGVTEGENNEVTGEAMWAANTANPVPEPATLLLMASGLIGLAGSRKKHRG